LQFVPIPFNLERDKLFAEEMSCGSVGAESSGEPESGDMPRVSAFFGIIIAMYYNDHAPPHFHAIYQEMRRRSRSSPLRS